jgi:drug/metabolite transporter (DMT)-like permease
MSAARVIVWTALAMGAFAANSLLCRLALRGGAIDAVSFTALRLLSGAVMLAGIAQLRRLPTRRAGSWPSALALFAYAACFSWAYRSLPAGTGALLLFGAVQVTMIATGLVRGERLHGLQWAGFAAACVGLVALLLPGLQAPSLHGALLMLAAGVAWGVYSLRGRGAGQPLAATAGNFRRAALLAVPLGALMLGRAHGSALGVLWALLSGALASGLGYAAWYGVLPALGATRAATVQLTVPAITSLGAVLLLGEPLSGRLVACSIVILGGVWAVIRRRR